MLVIALGGCADLFAVLDERLVCAADPVPELREITFERTVVLLFLSKTRAFGLQQPLIYLL
jgi:hypothetical protein